MQWLEGKQSGPPAKAGFPDGRADAAGPSGTPEVGERMIYTKNVSP